MEDKWINTFFFKLLFAFPSIVQQDLSGNKTLVWLICNLRKLKITGWLWSFEFFVLVTKYSKTRWFSHSSASAIFSCQIAIWRFFTKTVVDYYARENGEKKVGMIRIISKLFLKSVWRPQNSINQNSDFRYIMGFWTVQKQFWYRGIQ